MSPISCRGVTVALAVPAVLAGSVLVPMSAAAEPGESVAVIIEFDSPGAVERVGADRIAESRSATGDVGIQDALSATYSEAASDIATEQDAAVDRLRADGIPVAESRSVTGLINAVIAEVPERSLDELSAADGVAYVTRDVQMQALTIDSVPSTGAPAAWEEKDADGTALRGEGMTVAVIDTGVDYGIADLGGGFGEGHKVVGGYDFVAGDDDPMDEHYHGTHVAGIVAGTGAETTTGVAPDASITAWRVLDANGSGMMSDVLAGFEAAVDPTGAHPADVVNMSLGGPVEDDDPLARASTAAVEAGTVVVAAAGNSGPYDETVGSPASAPSVIAVGASTTGIRTPSITLRGATVPAGSMRRYPLSANPGPKPVTARVIDVGSGTPEDYERVGDVTGAIVVYQSPTAQAVTGYDMYLSELAEQQGAIGALVYQPTNAEAGTGDGPMGGFETDASGSGDLTARAGWDQRRTTLVMMSLYGGDYGNIRRAVLDGKVTATITGKDATDLIASFSSRGPAGTALKPEIVAPGVEIRSDIPAWQGIEGNAYRLSGTSMAAPHVAGAAALVRQAHPDESALKIRARLIGSARDLDSTDAAVSPFTQGAGALAVDRAVAQDVTASPDALSLGLADTAGDVRSRTATVTLTNSGRTTQRLKLRAEASEVSDGRVDLSAGSLTLKPGGRAEVRITLTPGHRDRSGEVSGELVATGAGKGAASVRVPYALLVRPLVVRATPDVVDSATRVVVQAPAALDRPSADVVAPSGRRTTVTLSPQDGRPGWYAADLELREAGVHRIDATGTTAEGRRLGGTGSLVALGTDRRGDWEQVGPIFTGGLTVTSPDRAGTAIHVVQDGISPFWTSDGGQTWTRMRSMPVAAGVGLPAADPAVPGGFWLAVNGMAGRDVLDATYQGRLLHSADGGKSWQVTSLPDEQIQAVSADRSTVAVATAAGLRFSHDHGRTWDLVPTGWTESVDHLAVADGRAYVQTFDGVWRVDLTGQARGTVTQVLAPESSIGSLSDVAVAGDTVIATVWDTEDATVLRSDDAGATWKSSQPVPGAYTLGLSVAGDTTYLRFFDRLYASTDQGATATPVALPEGTRDVRDVDAWQGGDGLVVTTNAGVWGEDRDAWTRYPLAGGNTWSLTVGADAAKEPVLRTGDAQGIKERKQGDLGTGRALDWGLTGDEGWIGLTALDVEQSPTGAREVWWVRQDGFLGTQLLRRSLDGTDTRVGPHVEVGDVAVSPLKDRTVATTYGAEPEHGILVSTDGFATWTTHPYDLAVRAIEFDASRPERLWIAASEGLYRSDDLGATLTKVADGPVRSLSVEKDVVLAGTDGGALVSTDGGKKFRRSAIPNLRAAVGAVASVEVAVSADTGGRPGKAVRVLVAGSTDLVRDGVLASGAGAFVSTDEGRTWQPASGGLTALDIRDLAVSQDGRWLYAGTSRGGVVRTATDALVSAIR